MGKIILFASGKGGVGKSTLCANIAACLAESRKRVLLIDTDLRLRNLDIYLGLCNEGLFDVQDLCLGRCEPEKAILRHPDYPSLSFIPGPARLSVHPETISSYLADYAEKAAENYDFVFFDCPSGIEDTMLPFFRRHNMLLLVATPDNASIRDAERIAEVAYQKKMEARLVVNRIRPSLIKKGIVPDVDDVIDGSTVRLLGIVPEDLRIAVNSNSGILLPQMRRSRALTAMENIAGRLCGKEIPLYLFK